jgi:glycosyltransferase involved in cell wall biosynthesis
MPDLSIPPRFSLVVPAFNRAAMMPRVIESALRQDFRDFELLVVDDGSSDETVAAVERYTHDSRVRLIRHSVNRGVCAARNTAIDHARAPWLVMLDSDFELLPGGLARLDAICASVASDVGNAATTCCWDTGKTTPSPHPGRDLTLAYPDYLRFVAGLRVSEWFNCIRREVFDQIRFPTGRAYEAGLHLGLAKRWRFHFSCAQVALIHTDATNRITASPPLALARRSLRDAPDMARNADEILREHGDAMRAHAPALYTSWLRGSANLHLLAGERAAALRALGGIPWRALAAPSTAALVALGLFDRRALAFAQGLSAQRAG